MSGKRNRRRKKANGVQYRSESSFVGSFVSLLTTASSPFEHVGYTQEFDNGTSSRPDVILVTETGEVIAIEAKLARWRDAVSQAYRNTFFADRSFVLLPPDVATRAASYERDLCAHGVGICTVVDGAIQIVREAPATEPYNIYRRELARERVMEK